MIHRETKIVPIRSYHGEPLRYLVGSRGNSGDMRVSEYLVDLGEYRGNGACGCQNFQHQMQNKLEDGADPSQKLRCFHIKYAREMFVDEVLQNILKLEAEILRKEASAMNMTCCTPLEFKLWQANIRLKKENEALRQQIR